MATLMSIKEALKQGEKAIDTQYSKRPRCTVIKETAGGAVVIYDDEPNCVVSTANFPGRFERV